MKRIRKIAQLRCLLLAMSLGVSAPPAVAFDPREASVGSINAAFDTGELTAEQVVRAYLERIAAYDKQGPAINALISLNPAALVLGVIAGASCPCAARPSTSRG